MGLFSFFKFRKADKTVISASKPNEYLPSSWEDEYCRIEIIPTGNKTFIESQAKQVEEQPAKSRTDIYIKGRFTRNNLPVPLISKEIRADYLERKLIAFKFRKVEHIQFRGRKLLDCETNNIKAFGSSSFTIFFDVESEFVKNICIKIDLIVSASEFDLLEAALYDLGKSYGLLLINWYKVEIIDLANKKQVQEYLMGYWK